MTVSWWRLFTQLVRNSEQLVTSYIEANRALLALVGGPGADTARAAEQGEMDSSLPGLAYRQLDWRVDREIDAPADLTVGDSVTFTKELTDENVRQFARITGDTNRLHLDDAFAAQTRFEGRIIHGTLLAGLISAALARLPGLPIYLSQDLEFRAPARPGETLTTSCEIVENIGEQTYRLRTRVFNEADEVLIDGEAVVLIDDRTGPAESASP